ncbi:MAG TPA: alpha/beta fold hydrolase [Streptosporangiaceae bacterium]|nr:alpha/beta fold hydrolase [Streptosporangiaceae bacterium]
MRLSGWYIPAHADAAVILLPGAGETRTAVLGQAAVLARHGYGALLVDTRGHGRSAGHAMDFGWWGDRDVAAAVSFLARQPRIQAGKIAVLGESMGGEQALAAAGSDPRIRAVVAEGAEGQQLADRGWRPHDITGIIDRGMEWVQYTVPAYGLGAGSAAGSAQAHRSARARSVRAVRCSETASTSAASEFYFSCSRWYRERFSATASRPSRPVPGWPGSVMLLAARQLPGDVQRPQGDERPGADEVTHGGIGPEVSTAEDRGEQARPVRVPALEPGYDGEALVIG